MNQEEVRIRALMDLMPPGVRVLEIGARDGRVTAPLSHRFSSLVALDMRRPDLDLEGVGVVQGDVRNLPFESGSFDGVVCTEVLEHVPSADLDRACRELVRVTRDWLVVGVPCDEDLRAGRLTCSACGRTNPPYGHLNSFTEERLRGLFPSLRVDRVEFVGEHRRATNSVSSWMHERLKNPRGTYFQEEACVHCGAEMLPPPGRWRRVLALVPAGLTWIQSRLSPSRPIWIHLRFRR